MDNKSSNKVTIKDIAREAGVSVATVSYVLNDRQDQKISEATRNRVLHIVNMLGYSGNRSSRALVRGKTNCIALCSYAPAGSLLAAEHMLMMRGIVGVLEREGYDALLIFSDKFGRLDNVDAIICIDATHEQFRYISQNNFIPVLAMNMVVNDTLFCQVNFDYSAALRKAQDTFGFDFCVVTNATANEALHKRIYNTCGSDVYFADTAEDLVGFLKSNGSRPLAVCSNYAYSICKAFGANSLLIPPKYEKMTEAALEHIKICLSRKPIDRTDIVIF